MKQLQVKYCKWGLANYYGDYIELNEALKDYPELRMAIMKHELSHSKSFDLAHEFNPMLGVRCFKFIIKHPRTWIDFLPIQYKKEIIIDTNLLMIYAILIFLGFGISWIIKAII